MRNNPVILLLFLFAGGMFLAQFMGMVFIRCMYPEASAMSFMELGATTPGAWNTLRVVQMTHSIVSMVIPAMLAIKWTEGRWLPYNPPQQQANWGAMIFIPVLLFTLMPLMQTMYVFNQGMSIPGHLGETLRTMEDQMIGLINGILKDNSPGAMILNVFLMVVLAAVSEELFFRGALQRFLVARTGDEHVAIFISAAFFSAVHMQFYGFLPRLALGILFGYMYWRTGRLLAPMLAHALFNGLQIGTYYYAVSNGVEVEKEDLLLLPPSFTIASTLLFSLMYYSFHQYTEKKE